MNILLNAYMYAECNWFCIGVFKECSFTYFKYCVYIYKLFFLYIKENDCCLEDDTITGFGLWFKQPLA